MQIEQSTGKALKLKFEKALNWEVLWKSRLKMQIEKALKRAYMLQKRLENFAFQVFLILQ